MMRRKLALILAVLLLGSLCLQGTAFADSGTEPDFSALRSWTSIVQVLEVQDCLFGLRADGTVLRQGSSVDHQGNSRHFESVDGWQGIRTLVPGGGGVVGLKADGTVVSTCGAELSAWHDIVQVVGHRYWIAGLKADGTVVITGKGEIESGDNGWLDEGSWFDLSGWRDIVELVPFSGWTAINGLIGIRADGTVVQQGATPLNYTDSWTDIVSVGCILDGIIGVCRDGTLALPPWIEELDADADGFTMSALPVQWSGVESVYAGHQDDLYAVTSDGHVQVMVGFPETAGAAQWDNIEKLYPTYMRVMGLKNDGTVVYTGDPQRCDPDALSSWRNIKDIVFCSLLDSCYAVGLKTDGTLVSVELPERW